MAEIKTLIKLSATKLILDDHAVDNVNINHVFNRPGYSSRYIQY